MPSRHTDRRLLLDPSHIERQSQNGIDSGVDGDAFFDQMEAELDEEIRAEEEQTQLGLAKRSKEARNTHA